MQNRVLISIAKAITPTFIKTIIRRRRDLPLLSWQAACKKSGAYQDDLVNRFRAQRAALRTGDNGLLQSTVLLMAARALAKPDISVTDFGGSTGELGEDFLALFPDASYTVVENPALVKMMQGRSAVRFSTEIPQACDIFFTSGTLQYLEDPLRAVRQGLESAQHAAIFVRNCFAETEAFHVQHTYLFDNRCGPIPEGFENCIVSYPHRTLIESDIVDLAQTNGFQCIAQLEEYRGTLFGLYGGQYGRQLVFWRS